ncbi:D-inositol-3-phosphate glycosyltransferase [subsurface metagenome]
MKILIISTSMYNLPPPGYSGLEFLCYQWACEFTKAGHQVSVVCPGDSQFPPELNIEVISVGLREPEDAAYLKYKNRLESGEFDAIMDNTWYTYSVLSQMEADKQLPIIHCWHTDPYALGTPPPIQKPCMVAFSEAQANIIRSRWNCAVMVQHHGIDLNFYKPDPSVERGNRYLFLARYTPEKGFLEIAHLAKKCKVGLDAFGDIEVVANQDYVTKCFNESDGRQIRVNPGISREETVKQYQSHKALITWPNFVEIFGLTTVESMACGCPVISKDSGAARELIKHGKTGFVVGSLEEAEELIKSDAVSKLKTEDIVKQGRRFSIEKSAKGHLRLLKDVASGLLW